MKTRGILAASAAVLCLGACSTVNDGSTQLGYWKDNNFNLYRPESDQKLGVNDNFSISLHKAFIAGFQEWPVSTNATATGRGFARHGEIAVLVKATEAGAPKEARQTDP